MTIGRPEIPTDDVDHALSAPITKHARETPTTCYSCHAPLQSGFSTCLRCGLQNHAVPLLMTDRPAPPSDEQSDEPYLMRLAWSLGYFLRSAPVTFVRWGAEMAVTWLSYPYTLLRRHWWRWW